MVFNFIFVDRFEGKSFTTRNIGSIEYLFSFYNAWMIFVMIDNISNRLYGSVFKICAKGFWFRATALFNNIYVINIKQFSQLLSIGDNFVFMSKCYIVISNKIFICKERLHELSKTLTGYEFSSKNHFAIFKVEKATEFHCSGHYPNKLLKSFNY